MKPPRYAAVEERNNKMRVHLLPETGRFYKANLHCHTTLSDGCLTPEEIKKEYTAREYAIVAFTDHNRFVGHNELTDAGFLALNGYEADISDNDEPDGYYRRCYHFNCFAADKGERAAVVPLPAYKDMDGINAWLKRCGDAGFLVCYNHPYWSLQTLDDYRALKGLFASEIFNFGAYHLDGLDGNQTQVYDTLLRLGNRIGCVAADDNHNNHAFGHPLNDSFGGWVMVKAEKLNYEAVISAFKKGNYYASAGPAIESLYVEDNIVTIVCSEAVRISCTTAGRHGQVANAVGSERLTQATFSIHPSDVYFRLEVMDERGDRANSRAYFLDELFSR